MSRPGARLLEALAVLAILALAGWLRFDALDRSMVADELRWTCRSISFHEALAAGRWAETFQVGHPGVVTMWLGTLALPLDEAGPWRELCPRTGGGQDLSKLDDVGREGLLQTVAPRLVMARRGILFGSLALLALLYLLLRLAARLGPASALAGWGLVALDPYLLAHSRVLHLDAMLALLSLAAVVALPAAARTGRAGLGGAALAGGLAGLAMLAKVSALALGPFVLLWAAWQGWRRGAWRPWLARFLVWGLAAALVYVLAWPSMWVDPAGTVARVLAKAEEEGASPHESGNFFLGQPVDDPGPAFYPVAAAYRLTPWVLLGLGLAAAGWAWERRHRRAPAGEGAGGRPGRGPPGPGEANGADRALVLTLLAWALCFGLVMTLGPKKFDRYLLPALLALDLAVGVALVALAGRWARRPALPLATAAGLLGLQALAACRAMPVPMAYYNPLLGGAPAAARLLLVGWGEGYELAADWLNARPGAAQMEASARSVTVFGPRFAGRTRSAEGYRPGRTDYVVVYINQLQRRRNDALLAEFVDDPASRPVFVGRLAGLDYVWVYPNRSLAPLRAALAERLQPGDVVVADGDGVLARGWTGPAPLVTYWGHWGEAEMRESLARDFPAGWRRAWVVRYPGQDPEVALQALARVSTAGPTVPVAGGTVELTPFERVP